LSNGRPAVFCRRRLNTRNSLAADPNLAAVLADMNRAVHRLHGCVRKERELVSRLQFGAGARQGFVAIADTLSHRSRIERGLFELARDILRVQRRVRTVIPFDHQGREPFLGRPHMVGNDRDGVVEPHDLAHAVDGFGRRIINALDPAAKDGRLRKGRDLDPRRPDVDTINGRPVDLGGCVQALGRGADELEIHRLLEHDAFGDRNVSGIGGKFAVFGAASCRRVKHFAALRAAGRRIDIPALCRGRHEHRSRGRTGLAQWLPRRAYGVRIARCLQAAQ
jgi:hypothetical protein